MSHPEIGRTDEHAWFSALAKSEPGLHDYLTQQHVQSGRKYLSIRHSLAKKECAAIDHFRYKALLSKIDKHDPIEVLRIAPAWLFGIRWESLPLPTRLSNIFKRASLWIVADLVHLGTKRLLEFRNFGTKSLGDLASILIRVIEDGAGWSKGASRFPGYFTPDQELTQIKGGAFAEVCTWFDGLGSRHPDLIDELSIQGIDSPADYLAHRDQLPERLRDAVDLFRYKVLRDGVNLQDPGVVLSIAPSALLSASVREINLPIRLRNVFERECVKTIGEIVPLGTAGIRNLDNIGERSVKQLAHELVGVCDMCAQQSARDSSGSLKLEDLRYREAVAERLRDHLDRALQRLGERDAEIIGARLGVRGTARSLQQLADENKITRERVRQILERQIRRIIEAHYWDDVIGLELEQILASRREPLYLEALPMENGWFRGFDSELQYLAGVIETFTADRFHAFKILGILVVTRISKKDWTELVKSTRVALNDRAGENWTLKDVKLFVEASCRHAGAPELARLLQSSVRSSMQFAAVSPKASDSQRVLVSAGDSIQANVIAVLQEAPGPMTWQEIVRLVEARMGHAVDKRTVHSALPRCGAKLFGRGLYGRRGLLRFTPQEEDFIRSRSEALVLTRPDRQWHLRELALEINKTSELNEIDSVTAYEIGILLEEAESLTDLGRMIWTASSGPYADRRLEVADLVVQVLEESDRPMSRSEIKAEVEKSRGLTENFQVNPSDRVMRFEGGLWVLRKWAESEGGHRQRVRSV